MKGFNKARLRAFIQRRKINAMGLLMITFVCALITVVCAIQGFDRTSILGVVTILLVVLCFIQEIKAGDFDFLASEYKRTFGTVNSSALASLKDQNDKARTPTR